MHSRLASRLARALGFTPSQDHVVSALLGMPPKEARQALYRAAAAALAAETLRDPTIAKTNTGRNNAVSAEKKSIAERGAPPTTVRTSQIPGAGAGLFSTRHIPRGGLVGLYAGVYTPPVPPVTGGAAEEMTVLIPAPAPSLDDLKLEYLCHLAGGGYLDGASFAIKARAVATTGACPGWGTAALANHPPKNVPPNVVAVDVAWAEVGLEVATTQLFAEARRPETAKRFATEHPSANRIAKHTTNPLKKHVPWYIDGPTNEPVEVPENLNTRGIAFLAARDVLPGEEIYFNYQLSKRGAPAWYAPVPVEVMWEILEKGNA